MLRARCAMISNTLELLCRPLSDESEITAKNIVAQGWPGPLSRLRCVRRTVRASSVSECNQRPTIGRLRLSIRLTLFWRTRSCVAEICKLREEAAAGPSGELLPSPFSIGVVGCATGAFG